MKNTDKMVHLLRTDPEADISALAAEDASSVTAKVVGTTHIPIIREILIWFVREVHLSSAQVVRREERKRVTAQLDAAQDKALLAVANRRIREAAALVKTLSGDDEIKAYDAVTKLRGLLKPVMVPAKPEHPRSRGGS